MVSKLAFCFLGALVAAAPGLAVFLQPRDPSVAPQVTTQSSSAKSSVAQAVTSQSRRVPVTSEGSPSASGSAVQAKSSDASASQSLWADVSAIIQDFTAETMILASTRSDHSIVSVTTTFPLATATSAMTVTAYNLTAALPPPSTTSNKPLETKLGLNPIVCAWQGITPHPSKDKVLQALRGWNLALGSLEIGHIGSNPGAWYQAFRFDFLDGTGAFEIGMTAAGDCGGTQPQVKMADFIVFIEDINRNCPGTDAMHFGGETTGRGSEPCGVTYRLRPAAVSPRDSMTGSQQQKVSGTGNILSLGTGSMAVVSSTKAGGTTNSLLSTTPSASKAQPTTQTPVS